MIHSDVNSSSNRIRNNEREEQKEEDNEEFFNVGNLSFSTSRSDLLKSKVITSPPLAKYEENVINSNSNL